MTSDPAARAALLRRLPATGFVPPEDAAPWSAAARGAAFAADVEAFAAAFWSLPPGERRAQWEVLRGRRSGRVDARLAELEAGLEVAPVPQADRYAAEVGHAVQELYPLAAWARAVRRREWLAGRVEPLGVWAAAARAFARADGAAARLDPVLLHRLQSGFVPSPVEPLDPAVVDADGFAGLPWDVQQQARDLRAGRRRYADRWIAGGVALLVGPFVLLIAFGLKPMPPSVRPSPVPKFTLPPITAPQPGLSDAQVRELLRGSQGSTVSTLFRSVGGRAWGTGIGPFPRIAPATAPTRR